LKNHGKGGAAGKARQYPPAQQTSLQYSFHRFTRLEVWIKPIYPNIGRNGGTTPTLFPWANVGGQAHLAAAHLEQTANLLIRPRISFEPQTFLVGPRGARPRWLGVFMGNSFLQRQAVFFMVGV
jgi:hypothetical protein